MALVDAIAHYELVLVIRCDIKPGSVDIEKGTISEKVRRVYTLRADVNSDFNFLKLFVRL
jgi:hypothetical protein